MKKVIFLIIMIISGCNQKKPNFSSIVYKNKLIGPFISSYIKFVQKTGQDNEVITVSFKQNYDTIYLAIVNSYPDLSISKFDSQCIIDSHRICFVGGFLSNDLYKIADITNIPEDIIVINKSSKEKTKIFPIKESKEWLFRFVNKKFNWCFPEDEIRQFVSLPQ